MWFIGYVEEARVLVPEVPQAMPRFQFLLAVRSTVFRFEVWVTRLQTKLKCYSMLVRCRNSRLEYGP